MLAYPYFKLPFILTNDASKFEVAAVLSQIHDELERPMAFASRQTNTAEQNSSSSELEMPVLGQVFPLQTSWSEILVWTHHSALTYLRNFSDQNSQLLSRSLKLSDLDFVVEHKTGTKIHHINALKRHVGTVTYEGCLDKAKIQGVRNKDCTFLKNFLWVPDVILELESFIYQN